MTQGRLALEEISKNMGIELPKSGDESQESQSQPASTADLQEDSQPQQKNPKLQILLIGLGLFSTLGVGTMLLLWGLGNATAPQVAKKPDSLPNGEAVKSTPEQQKEVADLKTKLVMEQQKADAARVAAEQAKAASPSPNPSPTPSTTPPVATVTATKPTPAATTVTATKPIDNTLSSEREKSILASLQQQKQQELTQLASLRQSRQQETTQLASLRQSRQRENSQLIEARNGVVKEQQKLASLRSQSNANSTRTFIPQPARVDRPKPTIASNQPIARLPKPVLASTQPIAQPKPAISPQPRLDWEQASALANYGGIPNDTTPTKPTNQPLALAGGNAMLPILRLPVGQVVSGKLVTPFYTLIGNGEGTSQNTKALATVTIDKAIEVGSGWHLPVGTAIEFELQIADNGMIQAVSKKVTYGNTQIDIPAGAFAITGNDNQPLFAQIKEVNGSQLAAADTRAAIFGGAAEIGNVLINSGNSSSVSVGVGTTIATQNNGSPNILGAVFKGAFSPQAQAEVSRANSLASKLQKMSKVGYLLPGTPMRVYVAQAATFQLPIDNNTPQTSSLPQNYPPTPAQKVARLDASATSLIVETPPNPMSTQSVINYSGDVVAPNPFYSAPTQTPVTPQPPALANPNYTTSPAQPPVTPQPPAIDPNYTAPTQPPRTSTQSVILQPLSTSPDFTTTPTQPPGTPNQSFTPQPPIFNPNYSKQPTQPITVQTNQGNYVIK
ncbi:hypothetical protein [Chamaesiphon minutus]|uniref:Uncharacterized protein n=1 Tax=Chamaesiphon minutus (strain ATCC 27169 / PCC 6605) TaxID=1173020 RepID=K9UEG1_CHAP6|nr:hypothetical protein [Chamaesiphon minutus]AFY92594.1 hypothetical protein Cha6605_1417 [Chamaesiphon minutus PCC 6605]